MRTRGELSTRGSDDLDMLLKLDTIDYDNVECISGRFCKLIDEAAADCNMKNEFSANRNASVLNQKKPMKKKWFNNTCQTRQSEMANTSPRHMPVLGNVHPIKIENCDIFS